MTDLAVPSRSSYVATLLVGTAVQGTITIDRKTVTIEPVKSTISEQIRESNNAADSMLAFPRIT